MCRQTSERDIFDIYAADNKQIDSRRQIDIQETDRHYRESRQIVEKVADRQTLERSTRYKKRKKQTRSKQKVDRHIADSRLGNSKHTDSRTNSRQCVGRLHSREYTDKQQATK